jgi:hypothetical protein
MKGTIVALAQVILFLEMPKISNPNFFQRKKFFMWGK